MNTTLSLFETSRQQQSLNPYYENFGIAELVEVTFLCLFTVLGTFGNFLVICSIIYAKRVFKQGNIFIINLAFADLIRLSTPVACMLILHAKSKHQGIFASLMTLIFLFHFGICGFFLPTVIANVIKTENVLPEVVCQFAGFMVTVTCACSVCNLAFIALNRYWSVAHSQSYPVVFNVRHSSIMVAATWVWSVFITSPTLFGWSSLKYDYKMQQCGWNDQASIVYNILLMVCAIFVPVSVISFCYWKLFKSVQAIRIKRNIQAAIVNANVILRSLNEEKNQRRLKKEVALLKTLAVTVIIFLISWMPYGVIVVFFSHNVPAQVKKASARLGLSNSAINFVIYGVMNPVYRRGYINFIKKCLCCCMFSHCQWIANAAQNPRNTQAAPFTIVPKPQKGMMGNIGGFPPTVAELRY